MSFKKPLLFILNIIVKLIAIKEGNSSELKRNNIKWRLKIAYEILSGTIINNILSNHSSSEIIYNDYGDRELKIANTKKTFFRSIDGSSLLSSHNEIRKIYIEEVVKAINSFKSSGSTINILEVGCGNGANLKTIKEKFQDSKKIDLFGFDISQKRIDVGRDYYKEALDEITLFQGDALSIKSFENLDLDIAFSICALEQLSGSAFIGLRNMINSAKIVVIVEPMPEIGSVEQKLYNRLSNQSSGLIEELSNNSQVIKFTNPRLIDILHNPLNPVGVCTVFTKKLN